jgi:hypothetical protein
MNNGTDNLASLFGRGMETVLPEGTIAIPLFGTPREAVKAGIATWG